MKHPPPGTDADLVRRAAAAFFRSSRVHRIPEAPDIAGSRVRELSGRRYVVLKRGGEVLLVYRVMTNGLLRAMNRPPHGPCLRAERCTVISPYFPDVAACS